MQQCGNLYFPLSDFSELNYDFAFQSSSFFCDLCYLFCVEKRIDEINSRTDDVLRLFLTLNWRWLVWLTLLSFSPSWCGKRSRKLWKPALMLCIRRRSLLLAICRRIFFSSWSDKLPTDWDWPCVWDICTRMPPPSSRFNLEKKKKEIKYERVCCLHVFINWHNFEISSEIQTMKIIYLFSIVCK